MKNIELARSQIEALEKGATILIFPISEYDLNRTNRGYPIGDSMPFQKGDKDIWVKEKFRILNVYENNKTLIQYKSGRYEDKYYKWQPALQMTKKQSRYTIDCLDVKVVKVQDLSLEEIEKYIGKNSFIICDEFEQFRFNLRKLKKYYNTQLKEANINRTYKNNDYVFLAEVKFSNYSKNF